MVASGRSDQVPALPWDSCHRRGDPESADQPAQGGGQGDTGLRSHKELADWYSRPQRAGLLGRRKEALAVSQEQGADAPPTNAQGCVFVKVFNQSCLRV